MALLAILCFVLPPFVIASVAWAVADAVTHALLMDIAWLVRDRFAPVTPARSSPPPTLAELERRVKLPRRPRPAGKPASLWKRPLRAVSVLGLPYLLGWLLL